MIHFGLTNFKIFSESDSIHQQKVIIMVFQQIVNKVKDFETWSVGFKNHADFRKNLSCVGAKVYTEQGNKNIITIIMEWSDKAKMQQFGQSDELKAVMKNAGVIAPPEIKVSDKNDFDVSKLELRFTTEG